MVDSNESDREGRGPNAPAESLSTAIQLLQLVRDRLGFNPASRETVAEALGYRTLNGTSRRKIAVLNHFDLLTRNGTTYRISDLAKQILMPRDEAEHRNALAAAARKPAFYQTLYAKYEGQALPGMLPNILVREFGILPQSSEEVARTFRDTLEFAGLYRNGILLREPELTTATTTDLIETSAVQPPTVPPPDVRGVGVAASIPDSGELRRRQTYTIPLDRRGSQATVDLPVPLREQDLKKISSWAAYMMSVLDDDFDMDGDTRTER